MLAAVTGASSGIGAAFARQLAARGWNLLLIARRHDRLRELADYLQSQYRISAECLPADLTDPEALAAAAARIRGAPDLGLLVNNAGFGVEGYLHASEPHSQLRMHRLHVDATVALTQAALANLIPRAQPRTGVINVSSVAAFLPAGTYGVTKTWMSAFTETIANELTMMKSPVRMQALCPGYTLTEFHDVTGIDRSKIPAWLWLPPDFVVTESLRGFDLGKLFVVPGWRYKLIVEASGLLPAFLKRGILRLMIRRRPTPATRT